jgi:hypothetical protein
LPRAGPLEERGPGHGPFDVFVVENVNEFPALLAEFVDRYQQPTLGLVGLATVFPLLLGLDSDDSANERNLLIDRLQTT